MLEWLKHQAYLLGQLKQAHAKRHKDSSFRTLRYIEWAGIGLPRPLPTPVLCIGPRNEIELLRLQEAGFQEVWGLDILNSSHHRMLRGDMHKMNFLSASFGLVWASHVLEHAYDPIRVFREIFRVLKPGGFLFAAWPTGFQTNWHDRHDYGNPIVVKDAYCPAGTELIRAQYRESADGTSTEWISLFRAAQ